MSEFWDGAGVALILFAIIAPISYCTVHSGPSNRHEKVLIACIEARGEWVDYKCTFPEEKK